MLSVETNFEDYTVMDEGQLVEGGVVDRCERCGRLGRHTRVDGRDIYEHRRTSPEETRETCVI